MWYFTYISQLASPVHIIFQDITTGSDHITIFQTGHVILGGKYIEFDK